MKACMGKKGAEGLRFYTKEVFAHLGSPFGILFAGFGFSRFARRFSIHEWRVAFGRVVGVLSGNVLDSARFLQQGIKLQLLACLLSWLDTKL